MRNVLRRLISLRVRSVLTLVHLWVSMFYVMFLEICRKSEPSVDFMRVGLFPFFTFLASLERSSGITL